MAAPQPNGISTRRMLDQYEVVAEIASGGMGTVYLARLARAGGFQRMVAIKLLHRHLAEEKHFVSMLLDEARLAARLHHPNAVGILDVRESELGYYLVMDYVDGFAMDDVLDRARSHEERMRLGIRILLDATTGLDAAHRLMDDDGRPLEIVHRDVSPQNVLVGRDGVGRITDFGVARAAERITSSRPGTIKGKPCYMAPEQAECRELDARADLFALGIVLWETLTGQLLFESEEGTMSILLAVLQRPIPVPSQVCPEVPLALERVCMKALERNVAARYQSGREFIDALTEAAAQSGMLVGSHAVADGIRDIFSADLDARQAAVRAHVSAIEKLPISDDPRRPAQGATPGVHARGLGALLGRAQLTRGLRRVVRAGRQRAPAGSRRSHLEDHRAPVPRGSAHGAVSPSVQREHSAQRPT
ncbi:MAG: serine/threonine protein kinase [Sandaracinaceae bacterium]|nr:serine/threonine protein kinase [Sandaracinaceae bacterium]